MFKGTVTLNAAIKGHGLQFPAFDFDPHEPGVEKVVIEGPGGDHVVSTAHFPAVATHDDGKELAAKVTTLALDRLTYHHGIAFEEARITGHQFSPVNPTPGAHIVRLAHTCI